jgi:AcrR family transcriptional regulator
MADTKSRIQQKVRELFFRRGFSKVTMDELAKELGMSKKTLYAHFSNKTEMLETVVLDLKRELSQGVDRILLDEDLSFPEKLSGMLSFIGHTLGGMEPEFVIDLKKSAPKLSSELESYKRDAAFNRFSHLLDEGIKKGYVRDNVDKSMVVLLYASVIEMAVTPEYLNTIPDDLKRSIPFHSSDMYKGMVEVMLKGVLKEC